MTNTTTASTVAHDFALPHSTASIEEHWRTFKDARLAYNELDPDDAENNEALWEVISACENQICGALASTPREIEIQLWCGMLHASRYAVEESLILAEDLPAIEARQDALEWPARVVFSALRSARSLV